MVSRVEHRHALVDGLLDDVVRTFDSFLVWNQDRIDDLNDAIGGLQIAFITFESLMDKVCRSAYGNLRLFKVGGIELGGFLGLHLA